MLSDSIFEAVEILWDAIKWYSYADDHKKQLLDGITELALTIETLDYPNDSRQLDERRRLMREKLNERWEAGTPWPLCGAPFRSHDPVG